MVKQIWIAGLLVVVGVGRGWGLEASPPFVAITDQGRAMVGATVTVVDSLGAPVVACSNAACSANITAIPASGIFQFWADAGTYNVTIAGSGLTRTYVAVIPAAAVTGAITDADFPSNYDSYMTRSQVLGAYSQTKMNRAATAAPTVDDDTTLNYKLGSLWVDTVGQDVYFAADVTDGAAVWKGISSATVDDGNNPNDTLFWDGSMWTPTARLVANSTQSGAGNTGLLRTDSSFQVGIINASTTLDIYSQVAAVINGTVIGQIRFGSTDSSVIPREAAFIKARAIDTWGSSSTSAATSLDFRVEANDGSAIGNNVLRIQPGLAMIGEDIPDGSLQGFARLVTEGISIADGDGDVAIALITPNTLDVTVKSYTLPANSGTAGYYLTTDGNSLFPTMSWEPIAEAPGDFNVIGEITVTPDLVTPSYSFIGDPDTGFGAGGGVPCIIDEGISTFCSTANGVNTFSSLTGSLNIATGATANDSINIIAVGGSGNQIEVNTSEFILNGGEVTFSGVSGDGTGKAVCVKANGALGTCTTVVGAGGDCTCA